ncbi:MAG: hypothetical protein ACXVCD_19835 [Pseudobdellovibrionaceae bacterium]
MDRYHIDLILDNIASEIEAFGIEHSYIHNRLKELKKLWNFSYHEIAVALDISYEEILAALRPKYIYSRSQKKEFTISGHLRRIKFTPIKIKRKK